MGEVTAVTFEPGTVLTSWVDPRLERRPSPLGGDGLFATQPIAAGEVVMVWGGSVYTQAEILAGLANPETIAVLDEGLYLAEPAGAPPADDCALNHSCDPNVWMVDAVTLAARRPIAPGEEVTADYALWLDEQAPPLPACRCGSQLCRGQITAEDWRRIELQARYAGHFTPYLNGLIAQAQNLTEDEQAGPEDLVRFEDVLDAIFARRSIRRYVDRNVEPEKLVQLLQAAMAAPTACNSQPWEFVVVTDREVLNRLQSRLYSGHYNAPAAIVVCGHEAIAHNSTARFFWVQDCAAATENILIAATGLGLGSVWIGVYPLPSVIKPVSEILNLPEPVVPLCVVYVGYPAEDRPPRTQYDEHRVHWQMYEPRKKRAKIKNAKYLP